MSTGYDIFRSQLDEAVEVFPSLSKVLSGGKDILRGTIAVVDGDGRYWEDYEVEIVASDGFPNEFPHLFEISGKIPRIGDWHIYEDTGSCCVKIKPEELIRCKGGITVREYIAEEVLPYLFNQTHRKVEGYYINGEYSHGGVGIYEFYAGVLRTRNNIELTIWLMRYIAGNDRPGRTSTCFCGSGEKFRNCHREAYDKLSVLERDTLEVHANQISLLVGRMV